jgi:hypothetical protein
MASTPLEGRNASPTRNGMRNCGIASCDGGVAPRGYKNSTRLEELCACEPQTPRQPNSAHPDSPTAATTSSNHLTTLASRLNSMPRGLISSMVTNTATLSL